MSSAKKITLLVVVVAFVTLLGPWSPIMSDLGQGKGDTMLEADEASFSVRLAVDRQVYEEGEPLALALVGINRAADPVSLRFSSGKQYDFTIVRKGEAEPIARWSAGRVFTMIVRNRELAPGETIVFAAKWEPTVDERPLPPGEYEVTGRIAAALLDGGSESVAFAIR